MASGFVVDGQRIALHIAEQHEARVFDPGVFMFMRLAITFTGSIILNPVKGPKRLLYPRISPYAGLDENGQPIKPPIAVDRVTMNAPPRKVVKEVGDYHDRTASNLRVTEDATATTEKVVSGREEAVAALMDAYDHHRSKLKTRAITVRRARQRLAELAPSASMRCAATGSGPADRARRLPVRRWKRQRRHAPHPFRPATTSNYKHPLKEWARALLPSRSWTHTSAHLHP